MVLVSVMELRELLILPLVPGRKATEAPLAAAGILLTSCSEASVSEQGLGLAGSGFTAPSG
jgi:hypothetical protein